MRDFPYRAWMYTLLVAGAATGAIGFAFAQKGLGEHVVGAPLLGFGLLFLLAESVPVELPYASYSVGFVVSLAAIIAVGPGVAPIAAAFGALDFEMRERPDWLGRFFFNGAQLALSTAVAGLVYKLLHGPVGAISARDFPWVLLPIAAATATYFACNVSLVAGMVGLVRGVPLRELWHSSYRSASLSHFSFAGLGVLLAVLYLSLGLGGALFLLLPLLVARGAFRASAKLHAAYDQTLSSLVTAIEAKDMYTRGHAERVSRLAEMVARECRLKELTVRQIRYAALMHDVGKLTVSTKVLQKSGKLTPEEFEHMKVHPIRGSEIVAEIDLLSGMVDGVRHHHERVDGRGYPDGLNRDQLSMAARIITVADAFDSMTSTRTYRRAMSKEAALSELHRCEGEQFDPMMVSALERAMSRNGWQSAPEVSVDADPEEDSGPSSRSVG